MRCLWTAALRLLACRLVGLGWKKRSRGWQLALAASLLFAGCTSRAVALRQQLNVSERRVSELKAQVVERDRQIAVVQAEIAAVRSRTAVGGSALAGGTVQPAAALPAAPSSLPPAASAVASGSGSAALPAASAEAGAVPQAAAPAGAAQDGWPSEAQRQIAELEGRLAVEVRRREEAEAEMARLHETSSGVAAPAGPTADQQVHQELAQAHREIAELRTALSSERAEHEALAERFSVLHEQFERAIAPSGPTNEEIAALTERQRRALADVQRELDASRTREHEQQLAAERAQATSATLSDQVSTLRNENTTLQQQLDAQRQHNQELSAKLRVASRVTDLIFKLRAGGAASVPPPGP